MGGSGEGQNGDLRCELWSVSLVIRGLVGVHSVTGIRIITAMRATSVPVAPREKPETVEVAMMVATRNWPKVVCILAGVDGWLKCVDRLTSSGK